MDKLEGRSSIAGDALLETTVEFEDGSSRVVPSGSVVSLSLSEWTQAVGVALDQRNTQVMPDSTNSSRFPFFRTTGMTILVDLTYTNMRTGETEPEYSFHRELRARAVPTVDE